MNAKKLHADFIEKIKLEESKEEIQQLGFMVMEHELGLSTTEILMEKEVEILRGLLKR